MSYRYTLNNRAYISKTCPVCGIEYYVPEVFEKEQLRLGAKGGWHCPNGHARVYRQSEADRLQEEVNRLRQDAAYKDDVLQLERRRVSAAKGQITKLKRRASNGVCPCCNRTFSDLQRHMHSKHPGFISEPDATEHVQH